MAQYFLPRGTIANPGAYGDLLRAEGLNQGASFGGSEIDLPDTDTPEQVARALALASGTSTPPISNADLMRFLAQQQGGGGPLSLPGGGDSGSTTPNSATPGTEGASFNAPSFNTDFSITPDTGGKIGAAIGGVGGAMLGGLTGPAAIGVSPVLGLAGGLIGKSYGPEIADFVNGVFGQKVDQNPLIDPTLVSVPDPNAAPAPPQFTPGQLSSAASLGISNPTSQGFSFSGSPTGFVDIAGNPLGLGREDLSPNPPSSADAASGVGPAGSGSGVPGDVGGVGSGQSGPAGAGVGGPDSGGPGPGDAGAPGDAGGAPGDTGGMRYGGRVPGRTNARGSFRNAKRFATGGGVPMYSQRGGAAVPPLSERQARAQRVRAFELAHANSPV